MNNLQNEMLSVILKDLPNQTAGVLKSYLDEAAQTKKDLITAQQRVTERDAQVKQRDDLIAGYQKKINDLEIKLKFQSELEAEGARVAEAKRVLDVTLLSKEVSSLQRENAAIQDLARTVFKNPTLVRSKNESVPVVIPGNNGCSSYVNHETKQTTEKETVE